MSKQDVLPCVTSPPDSMTSLEITRRQGRAWCLVRSRVIKLAVTPPFNHFCLSKAFLIGFEMDYPNQTVNLRHVASVDR